MAVKREAPETNSSDNVKSYKLKRANTASPPKKKYTFEDSLLIRKLKEENGIVLGVCCLKNYHLTRLHSEIAEHFPGCSGKTLGTQW